MANEDNGYTTGLGKAEQGRGTLANLGYGACRRLNILSRDGLYGVDDEQFRLYLLDMVEDGFEGVLSENHEVIRRGERLEVRGEAFGAHLELVSAFLTTDVKHTFVREVQHGLQG